MGHITVWVSVVVFMYLPEDTWNPDILWNLEVVFICPFILMSRKMFKLLLLILQNKSDV